MKIKLIPLVLVLVVLFMARLYGQNIGSTETPYDTEGWDLPEEYTEHYQLPVYRLLSNPGGWINLSQRWVDSLFHALIVYTKDNHFLIVNDTLQFSSSMSGIDEFDGTATACTVTVPDLEPTDPVVVSPIASDYSVNDNLRIEIREGDFIVRRNTDGTSNLKFSWIWIRKY